MSEDTRHIDGLPTVRSLLFPLFTQAFSRQLFSSFQLKLSSEFLSQAYGAMMLLFRF